MIELQVAPGIHRIETAYTNCYLIESDGDLTLVDCLTPPAWNLVQQALGRIGRDPGAIKAIVLTHGHFDHVGFAEHARSRLDIPVFVHAADQRLTRKPSSYEHERSRLPYLMRPKALPIVAALLKQRAFWPRPIQSVQTFVEGTLSMPGSPHVVFTPGHTWGHCGLHLSDRDTLITGDALVTLNPYTGDTGPQIVAGAATADSSAALSSLGALGATGATNVLTGHGEPWRDGIERAVELARIAGPS